jgi:hypothetical protein
MTSTSISPACDVGIARDGVCASTSGTTHRKRTLTVVLCALLIGLQVPRLVAQDSQPPYQEYHVKAVYLSNLGRFVDWSSRPKGTADEQFEICVLGQDPFGRALDAAIAGENIIGETLVARRLTRVQEALSCRVLFISSSEEGQLPSIMAALGTAPVLTVADVPDFIKRGGMIQFILDANKVKFEINIAVAQRAGLKLRSDLLNLARVVRKTL